MNDSITYIPPANSRYRLIAVERALTVAAVGSPIEWEIRVNSNSYMFPDIFYRCINYNGTLAASTIQVFDASGGMGNAITTANSLTNITGLESVERQTNAFSGIITSPILYHRQTVNSANAGRFDVYVWAYDMEGV